MEKQIKIGVDSTQNTLRVFIDTWKRLENAAVIVCLDRDRKMIWDHD